MDLNELIRILMDAEEARYLLREIYQQVDSNGGYIHADKLDKTTLKRLNIYFGFNTDE